MKVKTKILTLYILSTIFFSAASFCQEFAGPVRCNPLLNNHHHTAPPGKTLKKAAATLFLPFFEDFTGYNLYPDSNKWADFEVYINNTMGVRPISRGVATFDDLNAIGIPYDSFNNSNFRYADSLTSQPIDISGNTAADSVYLSFFYQPQGNGFYPLNQDSLQLYLKTIYGGYQLVWSVPGTSLQPFKQVMIPITDSLYFHNAFQFRFVNRAALYWADAVWNVDYIRMDQGRNMNDTGVNDIAFTSDPTFFLNDYTSMPYRQFMANPPIETAPKYTDSIHNNLGITVPITYGFSALALNTGATLQSAVLSGASLPPGNVQQITNSAYTSTIPLSSVKRYDRVVFENTHFIQSSAFTGPSANDTIIKDQVFDNYLAYDDGSAEKSYYLNLLPTLPGKIQIEYHLNQPDTLRGMAVYFGRQIPFPFYKAFSIQVYSQLAGVNGSIGDNLLLQQDLNIPFYVDSVNHFTIYKLDNPFPMPAGTFYMGTLQPQGSGDDSIYFGLDVNRIGGNHAYYNVLNLWNPSLISGAIMMRPLLGQTVVGSGVHNVQSVATQWQAGPNPAKNTLQFTFDGDDRLTYRVADIQGRILLQGMVADKESVDISQLIPGMYFVTLTGNGVTAAPQKIVKL
jgi:hypothetical protein